MTLLAIVVVISWLWMMTTALHLDDARTEGSRNASAISVRRRLR
jgi:hypothetical protein